MGKGPLQKNRCDQKDRLSVSTDFKLFILALLYMSCGSQWSPQNPYVQIIHRDKCPQKWKKQVLYGKKRCVRTWRRVFSQFSHFSRTISTYAGCTMVSSRSGSDFAVVRSYIFEKIALLARASFYTNRKIFFYINSVACGHSLDLDLPHERFCWSNKANEWGSCSETGQNRTNSQESTGKYPSNQRSPEEWSPCQAQRWNTRSPPHKRPYETALKWVHEGSWIGV